MDRPDENPDGYNFGSVMIHADKLKGALVIEHGDMDDNVHLQNSIQLVAKLLGFGKDFELVIVPDARHGIESISSG